MGCCHWPCWFHFLLSPRVVLTLSLSHMTTPNLSDKMREALEQDMWWAVYNELLARIRSGQASPTDISNAIKLLHQNGITAAASRNDVAALADELDWDDWDAPNADGDLVRN